MRRPCPSSPRAIAGSSSRPPIGKRPHLRPTRTAPGNGQSSRGLRSRCRGLLVEGALHVAGSLGRLRLLHTTLVPGRRLTRTGSRPPRSRASLVEDGVPGTPLNEQPATWRSPSASPVRCGFPPTPRACACSTAIVDGVGTTAVAGPARPIGRARRRGLERVTVFGRERPAPAHAGQRGRFSPSRWTSSARQEGCVRFSFVPRDSRTPRRYRCQPDLEIGTRSRRSRSETGTRLGDPERAAIATRCAAGSCRASPRRATASPPTRSSTSPARRRSARARRTARRWASIAI